MRGRQRSASYDELLQLGSKWVCRKCVKEGCYCAVRKCAVDPLPPYTCSVSRKRCCRIHLLTSGENMHIFTSSSPSAPLSSGLMTTGVWGKGGGGLLTEAKEHKNVTKSFSWVEAKYRQLWEQTAHSYCAKTQGKWKDEQLGENPGPGYKNSIHRSVHIYR
jgi:hypothetical protein